MIPAPYARRVLSGGEPAPVRARNVPPVPEWVKALDDAELAAFDELGWRAEVAALEAQEERRQH